MSTRFATRLFLAFLIVLTTGPMARAIVWDGALDTDWFSGGVGGNWSGAAVPGAATTVDIGISTAPNQPVISAGAAVSGTTDIGYSGGSGVLTITGGSLTTGAALDISVQDASAGFNTGTLTHTGGTVDTDSLYIGRSVGGSGLYTLSGGTLTLGGLSTSDLELENNGTFDFISGSVSGMADIIIGNTVSGSATFNLHGNTVTTIDDVQLAYSTSVGRAGNDVLDLGGAGGTLNVGAAANDDFFIGGNSGAGTTFSIGAGETVNVADNFYIGDNPDGKVTMNVDTGATLSIGGDWLIGRHATDTNTDTVNINDASGITMSNTFSGAFTLEGAATLNMNDTVNSFDIPLVFALGNQDKGVAILNMAADTTINVGTSGSWGSGLVTDTDVDQVNMGAGSVLNYGTSLAFNGWDGGGTITLADGTVNVGSSMTVGADPDVGLESTLAMTGADLNVGTTFSLASGLQPGDTTIDRFNQSSGEFGTGTSFSITYNGRADISGDAIFNTGTVTSTSGDLNIGNGSADPDADSRFTARGNSTINVSDDLQLATGIIRDSSTFTMQDNAVVNVGSVAGDDFNVAYQGTVNIEGGTLNIFDDFNVGSSNNAAVTGIRTVNQSAGTVVVGSFLDLAPANGVVQAQYNLTGGTLQVGTLATDELDLTSTSTGAVIEFNLDGGILNVTRIDNGTGNGVFNYGAGTLSPGFKGTAALTEVVGDLVMTSESKLTIDILTADVAGIPNDLLDVNGDLHFDGEIELNELAGLGQGTPGRFIIATYGGTLTVGTPELIFPHAGPANMFDYMTLGEVAVIFTPPPIPEPSTMTLLGLGLLGLVKRSRRRKK